MEHHIDCSGIHDPAALHRGLAEVLCFPDWYGHNLDALFDCLTCVSEPTCLVLENWNPDESWAEGFEMTFLDAQTENNLLQVVLEAD